ncbi:hypothetical protein [Flavobacterium sp.]|uniref:hypothetical protein n=1 Tax=Flavobacterium sp. TaxID=239 RepID=UPI0026246D67|nr:hypothetical protein [Flavobacterium sp.]
MNNLDNKNFCFTIMPFRGYFEDYYLKIYKPAIDEANLKPLRADDIYTPGTIINDIWEAIQKSKIILADLTEQNANVFYELGLAHASGKPVILLSERLEDVPFDLRALRVIIYNKNIPDWGKILQDSITKALTETLISPVKAILPTFLTIIKDKNSFVSESDKVLLELKSDIEYLKKIQKVGNVSDFDLQGETIGPISEHDIQILKMLSNGISQSEIAASLKMSSSYLEKVINRLKVRFNANNAIELIKKSIDIGLI